MSAEGLTNFVNTTVKYGGLINKFKKEPEEVARGHDMTAEELAAASSGDEATLVSAGVPEALANRWVRLLSQ